MTEWRLYPDHDVPPVSTYEFHADRERAPHLEQPIHRARLENARYLVELAAVMVRMDLRKGSNEAVTVSDLGCGDGGLLQLVSELEGVDAWGYDFHPASQAGWIERGVRAEAVNVFQCGGVAPPEVEFGDIAVCTEVLEHIADPHGAVRWIGQRARYFVASSPATETDVSHDAAHAWAWDMDGYRALLEGGGFAIERHVQVGMFQVILGRSVNW